MEMVAAPAAATAAIKSPVHMQDERIIQHLTRQQYQPRSSRREHGSHGRSRRGCGHLHGRGDGHGYGLSGGGALTLDFPPEYIRGHHRPFPTSPPRPPTHHVPSLRHLHHRANGNRHRFHRRDHHLQPHQHSKPPNYSSGSGSGSGSNSRPSLPPPSSPSPIQGRRHRHPPPPPLVAAIQPRSRHLAPSAPHDVASNMILPH